MRAFGFLSFGHYGHGRGLGDPDARAAILDLHPIRRIATLEEVAETVCFLAGPSGSYITGEVLSVSGGAAI